MKTPQLRLHARGVYYTRYWSKGKDRFQYFTADKAASEKAFAAWLPTWAAMKADDPDRRTRTLRIVQVAEQWLTHIMLTRGPTLMRQYRSAIAHFVHITGEMPADRIEIQDLESLAAELKALDYSPRAVNAYTKAAKRMLTWAGRRKLIPKPDFEDLRLDAPPRPRPEYSSPAQVRRYIADAGRYDPRLVPWLSLIYLTCARPSEVFRLIQAHHFPGIIAHGRFLMHRKKRIAFETRGKTQGATGFMRLIPLSAEALTHLEASLPCWHLEHFLERARAATAVKLDLTQEKAPAVRQKKNAGRGLRTSAPTGAKVLRSWGASELRRQRIHREDIRRVLGHSAIEPIDHYVAEDLEHLRALVSRLTLRRASAKGASAARVKKKRS